jgi:hypothetical protein
VRDVKPNANGEAQEVKIKVRINHNGVILISSANLVEKNGVEAEEPQSPQTEEGQVPQEPMETAEVSRSSSLLSISHSRVVVSGKSTVTSTPLLLPLPKSRQICLRSTD